MSDKEMLKEADEWLYSMKCLLSVKTDEEDRAYTQKRIDLFNWLIEQAERVEELERETKQREIDSIEAHCRGKTRILELEQQNKRYRESLSIISANLPIDGREHYVNIAREALEGESV